MHTGPWQKMQTQWAEKLSFPTKLWKSEKLYLR